MKIQKITLGLVQALEEKQASMGRNLLWLGSVPNMAAIDIVWFGDSLFN